MLVSVFIKKKLVYERFGCPVAKLVLEDSGCEIEDDLSLEACEKEIIIFLSNEQSWTSPYLNSASTLSDINSPSESSSEFQETSGAYNHCIR